MGRRGPAPSPTNVLKLRGSTLVTQRRLQNEVKGPTGNPECPDWLDEDGKAMWEKLAPQLSAMGLGRALQDEGEYDPGVIVFSW